MQTTRQKIIDVMIDLISEKGYDKTSIGQICEIVGVKKPAVYYYFKSKEEIFKEIVKEVYSKGSQDFYEAVENITTKEEYIECIINFGVDLVDEFVHDLKFRKLCTEIMIQTHRIEGLKEIIGQTDQIYSENCQKALQRGVELGVFRVDFDIELYDSFIGVVLEGISNAIVNDLSIDNKKIWIEFVKNMIKVNHP